MHPMGSEHLPGLARQRLARREVPAALSRMAAGVLALAAQAAVAATAPGLQAVEPPAVETSFAAIGLHARSPVLWDYALKGAGRRHGVGAPTFNVDGRDVTLCIEAVKPLGTTRDRKITRLNSSHLVISYAVFC